MDKQVSKVNKSDGRDIWSMSYSLGKEAFRLGFQGPLQLTGNALREWVFGWHEEKDNGN
jgi:hypothetical protein